MIKIRAEINEIENNENRKTMRRKSIKLKAGVSKRPTKLTNLWQMD